MNIKTFKEFCTGCGLCHSIRDVQFSLDDRGYPVPDLTEADINFCSEFCPASGEPSKQMDSHCVWGKYISVHAGWACDNEIRKVASSGGVLTAICCYLLDKKIVDGIIQIRASDTLAYGTRLL